MADSTGTGKKHAGQEPVNEMRAHLYELLMDAQQTIAVERYRAGISDGEIQAALDAVDERMSDEERSEDLYLSALRYFVAALGGRLEVRAVFGDEAVIVRQPEGG